MSTSSLARPGPAGTASPRPPGAGSPRGALLLGGAHGSLAMARSLGARGVPVWFLTDDHPLPGLSRHVARSLRWAGPNREEAAADLVALARRHGLDGWLLVSGADAEVRLVSRARELLATRYTVTTPGWDRLQWACDKALAYRRAGMLGLDAPRTYPVGSIEDVLGLDARFPLVLKPAQRLESNPFTRAKAWRVDDRAGLLRGWREAAALVGPDAVVVQEMIPGGGEAQFSYAGLWDHGREVAGLVARRTRQYPAEFGATSTYVETVDRPDVAVAASAFLASLDFHGLVEVEFKRDARDGSLKLLDLNPRPWSWFGLGRAAGVDFGSLLWDLASAEAVAPTRARPGVGWMHLARDTLTLSRSLAGGRLDWRGLAASWRRPFVWASFRLDDPLPALAELPLVAARVARRMLPRRAAEPARAGLTQPGRTA